MPKKHAKQPKPRRVRAKDLRVPVFPEEAEAIEATAKAVGLSVAAYLRQVGLGYQPRGLVDRDQVEKLLKINADQGRLGGLLKLWLSQDKRLDGFDRGQISQAVREALRRIESTQEEIKKVVKVTLRRSSGGSP